MKPINTMEYRMMNDRGEAALYYRWQWSTNRCSAIDCIKHQVWF